MAGGTSAPKSTRGSGKLVKDGGPSDQQQEDRSVPDGLGIRDRVPVRLRPPKGSAGTRRARGVKATLLEFSVIREQRSHRQQVSCKRFIGGKGCKRPPLNEDGKGGV